MCVCVLSSTCSTFLVCTATSLHWSVLFVPIDPSSAVVSTKVAITQWPTPTPSPMLPTRPAPY